jgi:hypothetical protein
MSLPSQSIQKLMRESFSESHPLVLDPSERNKVAARVLEMVGRIEGVDTKDKGYLREDEKSRFVCEFSLIDPDAYYYYGTRQYFRLLLDGEGRLTFRDSHGDRSAMVSDLDEVVSFVRQCKQRIDRRKALKAKRGKVRELQSQAIIAQVRKLAKEGRFDFAFEPDAQKLNLYVKLSEQNALELHIPFKEFKECLPRLGPAIASLRELYQSGIRFQIRGRRILRRGQSWITHHAIGKMCPTPPRLEPRR